MLDARNAIVSFLRAPSYVDERLAFARLHREEPLDDFPSLVLRRRPKEDLDRASRTHLPTT